MTRPAAIAAAVACLAAAPVTVQEPPARFAAQRGTVAVMFVPAAEVTRYCTMQPAFAGGQILACTLGQPGARLIVMPNPWECGSDALCAQLWRYEVAHAVRGWNHEAR